MKLSRNAVIAIILLITLGTGFIGFIYYKNLQLEKSIVFNESDQGFSNQQSLTIAPSNILSGKTPSSNWQNNEKALYRNLLIKKKFDILIVPFQVQGFGLDRATRSLMTAQIANAILLEGKYSTPDPYLASRALGDGNREFKQEDVYTLANELGVKKIIWGYVGHDRKNHLSLSVYSEDHNPELKPSTLGALPKEPKKVIKASFTDENPPIEAYQSLLPEILSNIEVSKLDSVATPNNIAETRNLPSLPIALTSEKYLPETNTLYFQLLASITPKHEERTRERFIEKSYLASLGISKSSPFYKVLKARTLMMLGLRPAALALLAEPKSTEEKELQAYLNGNLPTVEKYNDQLQLSIFKIIGLLEQNNLISAYIGPDKNKSYKLASLLKLPSKEWQFLITRAFVEDDMWAQFDNIHVKLLLDKDFPIQDYSAENILRGSGLAEDPKKLKVVADLSVFSHISKLIETDSVAWCCSPNINQPSKMDYLNLIEAIGNSNLMRRADFLATTQARPEDALKFLSTIESTYRDYPEFSLLKAKAELGQIVNLPDKEKAGIAKEAQENVINVWRWEQGQTLLSADAWDLKVQMNDDYSNFLKPTYSDNTYASDYPFKSYYPAWEDGGNPEFADSNSESALNNSVSNFRAFNYLTWSYSVLDKQDEKLATLLKSIEGRFEGATKILKYKAQVSINDQNYPQAEKFLKESIKFQPNSWDTYLNLSGLYIQQGKLTEARNLLSGYNGFKSGADIHPVTLSNYAYDAGSKFYWLGEFSSAIPFFKLASKTETGSDADISSQAKLKLLEGNYSEALKGFYTRANRYDNAYSYGDFLCLLHVSGNSTSAWDTFNILSEQFNSLAIWQSAMVGQRMESKSESEIANWTKQKLNANIGKNDNLAAIFFLQATVTDRIPSKESTDVLKEIATPAWKMDDQGQVVEQLYNQQTQKVLGPLTPNYSSEGVILPIGVFEQSKKTRIKSNLVYFSEAYRQIKSKNFADANSLLQEASSYYDFSNTELSYILPYYALTATQNSNTAIVESYLSKIAPINRGFDYLLAQAVILGAKGNTAESIRTLKSALYKRPWTENRSLQTEYEFADITHMLFEITNKSEYRELALDWAKKNEKFSPWFSWSYAMEAILTNNAYDRKKAIAIAVYLDPNSVMLKKIPRREIAIASNEFQGKIPFIKNTVKHIEQADI